MTKPAMIPVFEPDDDTRLLSYRDLSQIGDAADQILRDTGWGDLVVQFKNGEVYVIEITIRKKRPQREQ